jgi:hypothetical protein
MQQVQSIAKQRAMDQPARNGKHAAAEALASSLSLGERAGVTAFRGVSRWRRAPRSEHCDSSAVRDLFRRGNKRPGGSADF